MSAHPLLGELSPAQFMAEYWQKKPLVIRQAIPNFASHLSPEELAGMSLDEEIESRLVYKTDADTWHAELGPFAEDRFQNLPKDQWTVLIQGVDGWMDEVNQLMRQFDFVPSWRLDDCMISFATDGASVGPHYDNYDVFLIQAEGQRRWTLGEFCTEENELRDHPALRLLVEMGNDHEFILEAGDILYMPNGIAHHGVSIGESISYSMGFRAPALNNMISSFTDAVGEQFCSDERFSDKDFAPVNNPGEINDEALQQLRTQMMEAIDDPELLRQWFGRHVTEPKSDPIPEAEEIEPLQEEDEIQLNLGHRLAYAKDEDSIEVFADGVLLIVSAAFIDVLEVLCRGEVISAADYPNERPLLERLLQLDTLERLGE